MTGKMKLPPRKWYSLGQASQKLTKEIGTDISIEDMIHYLFLGYFLPYIHVKYRINKDIIFNNKIRIELDHHNKVIEDIDSTKKLQYEDIRILSDYCNLAIQGVAYPSDNTTKWLNDYVSNLLEQMYSEYGPLNDKTLPDIIDKFFLKNRKLTFGIDGLLAIKIESLYNGTHLISEELELVQYGLEIKEQELLSPPIDNIGDKILYIKLDLQDGCYIPAEDLIIVYDDLLRIEKDIRVNLRYVSENMDSNGYVPEDINCYIKGENIKKVQKTIEKTQLKPKKYYEEIVINNAVRLILKYPEIGIYSIINSIISNLKKDYGIDDKMFFSDRHYVNKVKAEPAIKRIEITPKKGKSIELPDYEIEI
ncbi:hypothetical protein A0R65_05360 [Pasteurella multocida subsp. multocida]|nr:hypothetical protein A0R65_05360 [Pasteurella multocida subsp. multocida]PNM08236.1 hypothetical protein A6J58_007865 [Pasteurella multocida]